MPLPVVTPMTPDDLDAIIALERRCFADPWTRQTYLADLTQNEMASYLVIRGGDAEAPRHGEGQAAANVVPVSPILAYGGLWLVIDEAHIATITSHPEWRGCGLGQWLLLALLDVAIARGAVRSTLEVRAGNLPAQHLYEKLGYEPVGLRRRYYRNGEDGLIMTTPPLADPEMQARLASARADALAKLKRCFKTSDFGGPFV